MDVNEAKSEARRFFGETGPDERRGGAAATASEERQYRCCDPNLGCFKSDGPKGFYEGIPWICKRCADAAANKYGFSVEWVPTISFCISAVRFIVMEANYLSEDGAPEIPKDVLIKGRTRFIQKFVKGCQDSPKDNKYFENLDANFKKWLFGMRGIKTSAG